MAYLTAAEAYEAVLNHTPEGRRTLLSIEDPRVFGSILVEDVLADRDIPPFHRAAVDGYAIRLSEMRAGRREFQITGTLRAGSGEQFTAKEGSALFIMTGAPVPPGFDAIIKVEESRVDGEMVTLDRDPPSEWANIARQGEDSPAGSVVLRSGSRVDSSSLPVLAAVGKTEVLVKARPTVALITTGDEVIPAGETPLPHQIRDSSSYSIRMLLSINGIELSSRRRVKDNPKDLEESVQEALKSDIVILTGGVSMGVADTIPEILAKCGVEKIFHRIQVKPGKPLFFGKNGAGSLVFGLPGNPVSSQVGLKMFVEPAIRKWSGLVPRKPIYLPLAEDKFKKHDLEEFAQAQLIEKDGVSALLPFRHHGSGDFVNLSGTDGLLLHPANKGELKAGSSVAFFPWRSL